MVKNEKSKAPVKHASATQLLYVFLIKRRRSAGHDTA